MTIPSAAQLVAFKNTAEYIRSTMFSGSLAVPSKFLGMHIHRYPESRDTISPAPTYGYGTIRSHDYVPGPIVSGFSHGKLLRWYDIEPAANGVYDWTHMDVWVDLHLNAGHDMIYMFMGTPNGYAVQTGTSDSMGHDGGGSQPTVPAGNTAAAAFITALFTRYNKASGGLYGTDATRIKYLEIWNEPSFSGVPSSTTFWWGTAAQLAVLGTAVAAAAKAVDANVKIGAPSAAISNSLTASSTSLFACLNASDGASGTLKDHIDYVSFHGYKSFIVNDKNWTQLALDVADQELKEICVGVGLAENFPRMVTEIGYDGTTSAALSGMTEAQMATWIKRTAVGYAMLGYLNCCFYSHDDVFIGNPSTSATISAALDFINTNLCGQTLQTVVLLADGRIKVTTGAGSFYI
jgi:hypothetical protein